MVITQKTSQLLQQIDAAKHDLQKREAEAERLLGEELLPVLQAIGGIFGETIRVGDIPPDLVDQRHHAIIDIGPSIQVQLQTTSDEHFDLTGRRAILHIKLIKMNLSQLFEVGLAIQLRTPGVNENRRQQIDKVVAAAARQLAAALDANVRYEHVTFFGSRPESPTVTFAPVGLDIQ